MIESNRFGQVWFPALIPLFVVCAVYGGAIHRTIPNTFPGNPGNVFIAGQDVSIRVDAARHDRPFEDYDGQTMRTIKAGETIISLGRLPVGFYRVNDRESSNWISLAVIAPLATPTPISSPIGLDAALAGIRPDEMATVANLAMLAGVNWVRDRASWDELEPVSGRFVNANSDLSVQAAHVAGLQVLQLIASSPAWAGSDTRRFSPDLRDAFRFFSTMAGRWQKSVGAFEPWNEADYERFGGHTGSEMASFQKAAYLGLKEGNPSIVVCQNVWAFDRPSALADFDASRAWPYFDTYNQHHYDPFDRLPPIYERHRNVAAGRPMWITECALPVYWSGDPAQQELSDPDLKIQSERLLKTYASSLAEGAAEIFYFLLPHYVEGRYQFGLLRRDFTPRAGYVALCAVGRLLSDATAIGRWNSDDPGLRAYLFRARPDGNTREVLVAWSTNRLGSNLQFPHDPIASFDHLGRAVTSHRSFKVGEAPMFILFESGSQKYAPMAPPPKPHKFLSESVSPIVFQAIAPTNRIVLNESAYRFERGPVREVQFCAYNFGRGRAKGTLQLSASNGWQVSGDTSVTLEPMERRALRIMLDGGKASPHVAGDLLISGKFGRAGEPRLSIRLIPPPFGSHAE